MFIYYHVHFHDDLSMHMGVRARNLKTKEKGKNLVLRKNDLETASFVEIFYTCFPLNRTNPKSLENTSLNDFSFILAIL